MIGDVTIAKKKGLLKIRGLQYLNVHVCTCTCMYAHISAYIVHVHIQYMSKRSVHN